MTITVSISDFRQNISAYIAKVQLGNTIILKDNKRGKEIAEINQRKQFDPVAFEKALRRAAGTITAKNHPEWRTKKDVIKWVENSRRGWQRKY